jgi:hypothetical protein
MSQFFACTSDDKVANTAFTPQNKEHRKYIYKQQMHPSEGRKRPKELQEGFLNGIIPGCV